MTVLDSETGLGHADIGLSEATARDYFALLKPRVMSLVVFTAFAGLFLAPGSINPVMGLDSLTIHSSSFLNFLAKGSGKSSKSFFPNSSFCDFNPSL